MKYGNVTVEQVDVDGNIVIDYDCSLSSSELFNRVSKYFKNIRKDERGVVCGTHGNNEYMLRMKNITYLGNPHPHFKKRIQIADDLKQFYDYALGNNAIPILLGVYTYKDTQVFCDFEIEDYVTKKAHNSSAHIYTNDISKAVIEGYFTKTDFFDNHIVAFDARAVDTYFKYKFGGEKDEFKLEIVRVVDTFFANIKKRWNGIECYKEMIAANSPNKYQPEWPGFYLEYQLADNIRKKSLQRLISYAQDKRVGGIDLDLYFPTLDCYGDLKTHAEDSSGIPGNDWDTIHNLINDKDKVRSVYYIVLELKVAKDSEYDYEVTYFWNKSQNKENLMSYSKKMKHHVEVLGYYILDINRNNQQHLKVFNQGKNSNGAARKPKIMIGKKEIGNFLIHRKEFEESEK